MYEKVNKKERISEDIIHTLRPSEATCPSKSWRRGMVKEEIMTPMICLHLKNVYTLESLNFNGVSF